MTTSKQYPIGEQDFANIRKDEFLYIDKTAFVFDIVSSRGHFLFFRPRRFGKSLLLSTMKYYFEGEKELFKGLAIEKLEKEWKKPPVIYLDLSRRRTIELNALQSMIDNKIIG